jgi:hypothetical protein
LKQTICAWTEGVKGWGVARRGAPGGGEQRLRPPVRSVRGKPLQPIRRIAHFPLVADV